MKIAILEFEAFAHLRNSLNGTHGRQWLVLQLVVGSSLVALGFTPNARATCREGCSPDYNTFLGEDALLNPTDNDTAIGYHALTQNTGFLNVGVGVNTLAVSVGSQNVAIGSDALANNTDGSSNTASGDCALCSNTTGSTNTATGGFALSLNTTGNDNTATGHDALGANTTGSNNTATGFEALQNSTGSNNTGTGYQAMQGVFPNATGSDNTATGYQALFGFTTGSNNTANGRQALRNNTTGSNNTATGRGALNNNTTASNNTATGYQALQKNTTGTRNTASGVQALQKSTTANSNTANGYQALNSDTTGANNVAIGDSALFSNTIGGANTAIGVSAGYFMTGSNNIAIGLNAGASVSSGSNDIDIGNGGALESGTIRIGTSGSQTNTYIAGISGVAVASGVGVLIDTDGHLGTVVSSARFKENIQPMDKASEAIHALKPVAFRYKHELDPVGIPQFGLVAEQVEKVSPALVARDNQGKPYTVRYEAVNAMLLNEFLKEHRKGEQQDHKIEELEATVAKLQSALKEQANQIQKMSAQIAASQVTPRVVANDR
jgi:hypothetical protein